MMDAAESGAAATLKALLHKHGNLVNGTRGGEGLLHRAARFGHAQVLSILLSSGVDGDQREAQRGRTGTMLAAMEGHTAALSVMAAAAEKGAIDLNAADEDGNTALLLAAAEGRHKAVTVLLSLRSDVDINAADREGWRSLHKAARDGHLKTCEVLVQHGADVHGDDAQHHSGPRHPGEGDDTHDDGDMSSSGGTGILSGGESRGEQGMDAKLGQNRAGALLPRGKSTPCHEAAKNGQEKVVRFLASCGADLTSRGDEENRNVFKAAYDHGHEWLCELMVAIESARAKGATDFSDVRAREVSSNLGGAAGEDNAGLSGAASKFIGQWNNYQPGRLSDGVDMPAAWKNYKWGWQRAKGF